MSPDCAMGRDFDHRSDIYSLGSILYECLTGRPPFEAENAMELLALKSQFLPQPLSKIEGLEPVDEELDELVMKTLQPNIEKRFQSMEEVKAHLEKLSKHNSSAVKQKSTEIDAKSEKQAAGKSSLITISVFVSLLLVSSIFTYKELFLNSDHQQVNSQTKLVDPRVTSSGFDFEQVGHFYSQPYKNLTIYTTNNPEEAKIDELSELEKIDGIIIKSTAVSKENIDLLNTKKIKVLSLKSCTLNSEALNAIGNLKSLNELNLQGVDLKERSIMISGNDITEKGLIRLGNLKDLELIVAKRCKFVSNQAPLRLKKYLPEVSILVQDRTDNLFPELKESVKQVF